MVPPKGTPRSPFFHFILLSLVCYRITCETKLELVPQVASLAALVVLTYYVRS